MYQAFFGFTEQPFSIAPDPKFLFLGPRHQEALAHLHHGLTGSGGFLLLTGEVGTGKTTLSRAIISDLADQLDVVFILNPKLSESELLASIAEGFGITGVSENSSLKALTDALSQYLMTAAERGKHPVVLIDEAQHLYPASLEQLRLLTNLESDAKKLLSVVLIGQPELRQLLQRQDLRQVAQRIVARYQLLPFSKKETELYINHRLERAGGDGACFEKQAHKLIWKYTQGTPRLINLLCDRALQIAAQQHKPRVTAGILREARTALPFGMGAAADQPKYAVAPWLWRGVLASLTIALLWQLWIYMPQLGQEPDFVPEQTEQVPTQSTQIYGQSLTKALGAISQLWQLGDVNLGQQPCERLADYHLLCIQAKVSLAELAEQGVPAIVALNDGRYILLRGYSDKHWLIQDEKGYLQLSEAHLERLISGHLLLLMSTPSYVNATGDKRWQSWVAERLAKRVPFSLQEAAQAQQKTWLVDTAQGKSKDDAWLFLSLAATAYQGPSLHDLDPSAFPQARTAIGSVNLEAQVHYPEKDITVAELASAAFYFSWPEKHIEAQAPAVPVINNDEPAQPSEANEVAEASYTLKALFEEAVRATPPVEPSAHWGFDVDAPRQHLARERNEQGVPLLSELTQEQKQELPTLSYEKHVYQSKPSLRWISLGQQRLAEGDQLGTLRVISIQPSYTIMAVGDMLFRVEALENL